MYPETIPAWLAIPLSILLMGLFFVVVLRQKKLERDAERKRQKDLWYAKNKDLVTYAEADAAITMAAFQNMKDVPLDMRKLRIPNPNTLTKEEN